MIALFVGMSVCLFVCEHKMNSLSESGMCAMLPHSQTTWKERKQSGLECLHIRDRS